MGSLCSCFRGRHNEEEEETVDPSEIGDDTFPLFPFNTSNNSAENSESNPVSLAHGAAEPTNLNHFESTNSKSSYDDCPTCLEEYTDENPKITAKCGHHYHLGCIYDWKERSETCPACRGVMVFDEVA